MSGVAIARATLVVYGLGVAGCATVPEDAGFSDVQGIVSAGAGLDIAWNRGSPADRTVTDRVRSLLARNLSVDEAVQVALLSNAGLQATYENLGIAQADLVEAGLLKNPVFDLEIRFPGAPRSPLEAHVVENFLDIFLLPLRKRVATATFEQTKSEVATEVIAVATRTRLAYYDFQADQQLRELTAMVVAAAEASEEAAQRIHDAGNLTDLELANEQALLAEAKLELAWVEADLDESREHLNALMGLWGDDTAWTIPTRLPALPSSEIPSIGIETRAVSHNLALQATRRQVEATATSLGVANASALVPEINVGLHSEREPEGTNTIGPSLSLPLPLFNQGQPVKARARAMLRAAQQRYVEQAVSLRADVRRTRDRMLAARRMAEFRLAVDIPLRVRIRENTQLEYNAMLVGVFQLLLAKQSEINAGRAYIDSLHEYWLARTELEGLVGQRLDVNPPVSATPPEESPRDRAADPSDDATQHHRHGEDQ